MASYKKGLFETDYRLTTIDEYIIAPMFGYKSGLDYYKAGRIAGSLHKIKKCPTMFIGSFDDPLATPESHPFKEFEKNPNLLMALTRRGGHCCHLTHSQRKIFGIPFTGFLSWIFPSSSWFAQPSVEFLVHIEKIHQKEGKK